jgi:hypothetical protein
MKPGLAQQALAGLVVLFVVAVTLAGGVLLAFSDNPDAAGPLAARTATATLVPLATLSLATATALPPAATATPPPPTEMSVLPTWTPIPTSIPLPTRTSVPAQPTTPPTTPPTPTRTATPVPTATPEPLPRVTPTSTGGDGICSTPDAHFTRPRVGEVLGGVVSFFGTATHPAFSFYKLELRQEGASTSAQFVTFVTAYEPVVNGLLGQVDTRAFPNGEYWVRLVVVDSTGNYPEPCSKLVAFRN